MERRDVTRVQGSVRRIIIMRAVTFRELAQAVRGRSVGVMLHDATFERVETDSRRIRPGDLFWALQGPNHDAHDHLAEAAEHGAVACVAVHGRVAGSPLPTISVDDTRLALGEFAAWYRRTLNTKIIGITGSVGKTSTRHMVYSMLSSKIPGTESPGNFNNEIGVPLSLLSVGAEDEFAAIELAASRPGEIGDLARLAQPQIGIITAVSPVHLETFGSIEEIARTKSELLDHLPEDGLAILNGDNEFVREMAYLARCNVLTVGTGDHCDLRTEWVESHGGVQRFGVDGESYELLAPGRHLIPSALATIAVGREFGMTSSEIAAGLREFLPVPGRCRVVNIGDWTVVDDTYNASPASMGAACEMLKDWRGAKRKILVTGDMLELGAEAQAYHQSIGRQAAAAGLDGLICMGKHATDVLHAARQAGMSSGSLGLCQDGELAELLLDCWLDPGTVVLVKGSRAMRMEMVLETIRELAARRIVRPLPIRQAA